MFFVTTFCNLVQNERFPSSLRSAIRGARTVGYFPTFDEASTCVRENQGDIFEHTYDFVLIEEVGTGLYPELENFWLYKWDTEKKCYQRIGLPDGYNPYHQVAFCLG